MKSMDGPSLYNCVPNIEGSNKSGVGNMLKKFIRNEAGATAIEYGLIAAGIAVAIAVVVFALGSKLNLLFSNINSLLP
jgi:pilus assembly protein Flp/PilA